MNEFKFSCPHCDQHILISDGYEGAQINCPACQKLIVVPPTPGAAKPPTPPAALGIQRPAVPAASSAAAPASARTAYRPPPPTAQKSGSRALKTILVVSAMVVGLAVLGGGGWYGWHSYSQHKAKVEAAKGNPAAQVPTPSTAQSAQAMDILAKAHQAYTNLTSLSVEGTSVSVIDMSAVTAADMNPNSTAAQKKTTRRPPGIPKGITNSTEVSIKLARPDLYRIEGIGKTEMGRMTMTNTIAVWSPGQTNYTLMIVGGGNYKKFSTVTDRNQAFMATAQSGGLAMAIPQMFFNEDSQMARFITDWGQTEDSSVDDQDCYTLTAKMMGQKMKLWVSKTTYMVLQSQITLGAPVSDADIEAMIGTFDTNTNKTPAQAAQEKTMAKTQAAMMTKIRGTITETYDEVQANPTLTADDFNYPVPRGIRLTP